MLEKLRDAGLILVVEDVYETSARHREATEGERLSRSLGKGRRRSNREHQPERPDLILVSWTGLPGEVLAAVRRIRERGRDWGRNSSCGFLG